MEKKKRLITTVRIILLVLIVLSVTVGSVSGKIRPGNESVPKIVSNAANPAYSGLKDTGHESNYTTAESCNMQNPSCGGLKDMGKGNKTSAEM